MTEQDVRLRMLYRLAEVAEGEELDRVRTAIAQRRSELELATAEPSAFDGSGETGLEGHAG